MSPKSKQNDILHGLHWFLCYRIALVCTILPVTLYCLRCRIQSTVAKLFYQVDGSRTTVCVVIPYGDLTNVGLYKDRNPLNFGAVMFAI